ncbi:unnamed protein product [Choristocarpus tenellus]
MYDRIWLSLMIGNSRLHWAVLSEDKVLESWDSDHLAINANYDEDGLPSRFLPHTAKELLQEAELLVCKPPKHVDKESFQGNFTLPTHAHNRFRVASVVPAEMNRWIERFPGLVPIIPGDVISGIDGYPTLGVDRALAVRGAAYKWGWPVLVVDCGSALTFTAGNRERCLGGGAILPGVRLQLMSLGSHTAQLPIVSLPDTLPPRWAMSTVGGIQSGVMWTIVDGIMGFIRDWQHSQWKEQDKGKYLTVVFTGGDGQVLHKAVTESWEEEAHRLQEDTKLRIKLAGEVIHWGMASLYLEKGGDTRDSKEG